MALHVRFVTEQDYAEWDRLFQAYAEFGSEDQTAEMRSRVWHWIMSNAAQTQCLVADTGDALCGFVHFRRYERPLPADIALYVDDMFVDSNARGTGSIDLLIEAVGSYALENGIEIVRWMTSETNYRARAVYDRHALRTGWVTYQLKL